MKTEYAVMTGAHVPLLLIGLWWAANRKNRRSLAHNFDFTGVVDLWKRGKLVLNTTGRGEIMQVHGSMQQSSQQYNKQQGGGNGNGNGGAHPGTRRVFPQPTNRPPPQQQSNPQAQQSRRSTMPQDNPSDTTQVVVATITPDDVGKTVRVAASDVQGETMGNVEAPPPQPSAENLALMQQIEALKRQNAQLSQQNSALSDLRRGPGLTLKVSNQGALSVYGLRRFPATYYAQEWGKLLADETVAAIKDFIKQNSLKSDGGVLDPNPKDANGNPVAHLTYQYKTGQK